MTGSRGESRTGKGVSCVAARVDFDCISGCFYLFVVCFFVV